MGCPCSFRSFANGSPVLAIYQGHPPHTWPRSHVGRFAGTSSIARVDFCRLASCTRLRAPWPLDDFWSQSHIDGVTGPHTLARQPDHTCAKKNSDQRHIPNGKRFTASYAFSTSGLTLNGHSPLLRFTSFFARAKCRRLAVRRTATATFRCGNQHSRPLPEFSLPRPSMGG